MCDMDDAMTYAIQRDTRTDNRIIIMSSHPSVPSLFLLHPSISRIRSRPVLPTIDALNRGASRRIDQPQTIVSGRKHNMWTGS